MEPVHSFARDSLETEDLLHLMPDREHEENRQRQEDGERDDEAQSRVRLLALATQLRVSARAVIVVGPVDRLRVDGRLLGNLDAAGGLSHAGSLVPLRVASTILFHRSV
jgi:hypothetical protein